MPYINFETNKKLSANDAETLKTRLGQAIGAVPGKTERWLMVGIEDEKKLYFAGSAEPCAMVEVSLLGNAARGDLERLSGLICVAAEDLLGIPQDRVYVSYMSTEHWGWNGSNF